MGKFVSKVTAVKGRGGTNFERVAWPRPIEGRLVFLEGCSGAPGRSSRDGPRAIVDPNPVDNLPDGGRLRPAVR